MRSFSEDVADELGFGAERRYGRAVAIVDLDGDGWEDVFVTDSDVRLRGEDFNASTVYRNRRGTFERWELGLDPEDLFANGSGVFGDFDNDGAPDLLLVAGNNSGPGHLALYQNRLATEGEFVDVSEQVDLPDGQESWWGATWTDVDADGWLDLLVTGSATRLLRNQQGRFVDETGPRGLEAWINNPVHKNPIAVDIDNDGFDDLVSGGGSAAVVFSNDGSGHFREVTDEVLPDGLPPAWWQAGFAAAAADFNQDGFEDIWFGRFWYQDYLMLNRGDGTFERHDSDVGIRTLAYGESVPFFGGTMRAERATAPTVPTTWQWVGDYVTGELESENTMGLSVGDLDNDGLPDVYIGTGDPSAANPDIFFCNDDGDAPLPGFRRCAPEVVATLGETRGHGLSIGDLDRDGRADLVVNPGGWAVYDAERSVDTREPLSVFLGAGDRRTTTTVRLTTGGRTAVGARIAVDTVPARFGTVRSGQGFQSGQSSELLSFRLDAPATCTVTWPGGTTTPCELRPGERVTIEQFP